MNAQDIIDKLQLAAHPEGGYFKETYRCDVVIPHAVLPARYVDARSASTCIYYMLTEDSFSAMHEVASDEIFHFYAGDPIEVFLLSPEGKGEVIKMGSNVLLGEVPQLCIPRGVCQGSRLVPGGKYALIGATVAPGFDYHDFRLVPRDELLQRAPDHAEQIGLLTRI